MGRERYVAFLRGMNLGDRRIANEELRSHFEALGCEASKGKPQVVLLDAKPSAAAAKKALAFSTDADRLAIEARELYWLPDGGISESELDLEALFSLLGQTTIRTKGTIDQIAARYFAG